MNGTLYELSHSTLDPQLAFHLAPFIRAYAPHTEPDLESDPIQKESHCSIKALTQQRLGVRDYRQMAIMRENEKAYKILSQLYYSVNE